MLMNGEGEKQRKFTERLQSIPELPTSAYGSLYQRVVYLLMALAKRSKESLTSLEANAY